MDCPLSGQSEDPSFRFPENNPVAYQIVQKMNFSNLDIAVMAKLADVDGMEPEEAAAKWLEDNESKWRAWLEGASS